MSPLARLGRLWHTLRHLRAAQFFYWLLRRGVQVRASRAVSTGVTPAPASPPVTFDFLNRQRRFARDALCWRPAGESRLWVYNLHYFDYLHDGSRDSAEQAALIAHWIGANPAGSAPGWEPYPLSLRLVNWCRWWLRHPDIAPPAMAASAAEQAAWLMRRLEKHILANHYFENLKALIFAGAVLPHAAAAQWLRCGQEGLSGELDEQFLPDGGHYERSPSYHCVLLGGLLDLLELDVRCPAVLDQCLMAVVRERATRALGLLAAIELPGDRYPLFNDSAFDSAPRPSQLYSRARALGLTWEPSQRELVDLPAFGVFGWRDAVAGDLMIKCGAVGPAYQPGHTHCDLLSFEWYLGGEPFIVDTGVYEYEPGPMRQYVRSTAAHNTVTVDDAEQSEIWGEFRVARRAAVLDAGIRATSEGASFDGEIRAFLGVRGGIVHRRAIRWVRRDDGPTVAVEDHIHGRGTHRLASRLLFHPDIVIEQAAPRCWRLLRHGRPLVILNVAEDCVIEWQSAPYCPEFGIRLDALQLVMRLEAALPARLSCVFDLQRPGA